jgi:hypothetical protein
LASCSRGVIIIRILVAAWLLALAGVLMAKRHWAGNCRPRRVSGCEEPARVIVSAKPESDSREPPGAPADGIPVEPQSCTPG